MKGFSCNLFLIFLKSIGGGFQDEILIEVIKHMTIENLMNLTWRIHSTYCSYTLIITFRIPRHIMLTNHLHLIKQTLPISMSSQINENHILQMTILAKSRMYYKTKLMQIHLQAKVVTNWNSKQKNCLHYSTC